MQIIQADSRLCSPSSSSPAPLLLLLPLFIVVLANLLAASMAPVNCAPLNDSVKAAASVRSTGPTLMSLVYSGNEMHSERNSAYLPLRYFRFKPRPPTRLDSTTDGRLVVASPQTLLAGVKMIKSSVNVVANLSNNSAPITAILASQTPSQHNSSAPLNGPVAGSSKFVAPKNETNAQIALRMVEGFWDALVIGMCEKNCTNGTATANLAGKNVELVIAREDQLGARKQQSTMESGGVATATASELPRPNVIASILSTQPRRLSAVDVTETVLNEIQSDDVSERLHKRSREQSGALHVGAQGKHERKEDQALLANLIHSASEEADNRATRKQDALRRTDELRKEMITSVVASKLFQRQLTNERDITQAQFSHILSGLNITNSHSGQISSLENWLQSARTQKVIMNFMHFG